MKIKNEVKAINIVGPVAQLVRAVPHNVLVPGSSPGGPTNYFKILKAFFQNH